jgi:adenylate cyclase class IV
MAKNAEFAQDAAKANATLLSDVYKTDIYFKAQSQNAAARLAAALGSNKGGYSEDQLGKLYAQVEMENRPRLQELYKDAADKDAKINEAIEKLAIERVNQVRGLRQKGNIPVPSSGGGQYIVQGGVD